MARDIVFLPVALPLRPQAPHFKEEEEEASSAETSWTPTYGPFCYTFQNLC
jgi:hypothetical protein